MPALRITNPGFISEFMLRHVTERPFCWVLGSGASVPSHVPSGGELVRRWLGEMHELENGNQLPIEQWATEQTLGIPGFRYEEAARFYPWIYERRYRKYKQLGYATLETIMESAEPSYGYSVLAQIMAITPHRVAVTTNFDNLIADALSIYTEEFPLVCGHESLTGYLRPSMRRPMVAKIHRDLLLNPFNNPDEISKLSGEWDTALTRIFDAYTPIVIGYGGNDGSLMNFLKALKPIEGGIFWCYRDRVDPVVEAVVEHHDGYLVPITGFDEVMLQLWEKLLLPSPLPELKSVFDTRTAEYIRQFELLKAALAKPSVSKAAAEALEPVRAAADAAVERLKLEKSWWGWELKAQGEPDDAKREEIYRAGLRDYPDSAELTGNFAIFMKDRRNDDEAERLYQRALELDPKNANNIGNYAAFLQDVRHKLDDAERFYRRALELDPKHAIHHANLGQLKHDQGADDEAESFYRAAVDLDPAHALNQLRLAVFLYKVRNHPEEAEQRFQRAYELDPKNTKTLTRFAIFMHVQKKTEEAKRLYREGIDAGLSDSNPLCNYAQLLATDHHDDEAREIAARAWKAPDRKGGQSATEIALTLWLLDRVAGRGGTPALGRLKFLFGAGFKRSDWSFDDLLAATLPRLPEPEHALARKLADAVLDETRVAALDDEPAWTAVEPIPLDDASWP